jgi:hypothetical protein
MMKPNFFIIGAPKCGTTSLSQYLGGHPNIFVSRVKEPHYFDLDTSRRMKLKPQTYMSLFANANPNVHRAVGEASTGYLSSNAAVPDILRFNPDAKLIVMLRNPVELVQALHSEMYFEGVEDVGEFERAWNLERERRRGISVPPACWEAKKLFYSELGKLGDQVERLFTVAPRSRIMVIIFDDFACDTQRIYEQVLTFLNVPSDSRTSFPPMNQNRRIRSPRIQRALAWSSNYVRLFRATSGYDLHFGLGLLPRMMRLNSCSAPRKPISSKLSSELSDFYSDDICKLSTLLSRDLSSWLTAPREPAMSVKTLWHELQPRIVLPSIPE